MFGGTTTKTRRLKPSHEHWNAHDYQLRAVDHLKNNAVAALFLDPGLGKTSITLAAFSELQDEGVAKKMLVIAPLRVCQLVWEQEGALWTQFKHLKFTLLHGPNKSQKLKEESDIYLINPEGCAWLCNKFYGKRLPFDTVCIDELTKFKNGQAVRHKALLPRINKVARKWGLTGTPIPNGYLDLWGQVKILDGGGALGQWFSHYRNKYFEKDFSGFSYTLRRGATTQIEEAISPYVLRMSADDYLDMPPLLDVPHIVRMPAKARKVYNKMKKDLVADLPGGTVEAGNVAAVYSKLKQMGNGAVYSGDGVLEPRKTIEIHDAKLEAIAELVEELQGTPVMIAYEFKHDLKRLRALLGKDTPYIGAGVTGRQAKQIEKDWNAGEIPVLLVHPQSAGHGLNLQKGDAHHIAWFSITWDYELYDQLIRRLLRQGNKSVTIFNHLFIVEDTIDIKSLDAIQGKQLTQNGFLNALNAEIFHDGKPDTSPEYEATESERTMVERLSRRNKTKKAEPEAEAPEVEEVETEEVEEETPRQSRRRQSARKLRGGDDEPAELPEGDGDEDEEAKAKFSKGVQDQLDGDEPEEPEADDEPAPKKRRTTRRKVAEPDPEPEPAPEPSHKDPVDEDGYALAGAYVPSASDIRTQALHMISGGGWAKDVFEAIDSAELLAAYINEGTVPE